jgi:diguanylate cyclase (GGDEF)-like protein
MIDIAAPTLYATTLYCVAIVWLVRNPPPAAHAAARFLAFSMLAVVVTWGVRFVAIWRSLGGTQDTERADLTISLFAIAQILTLVAGTLGLLWIEVRLMEAELKRAATTDQLTGVLNRRATRARFEEEIARAGRSGERFGLALFDIDHFKRINDTRGHYVGDTVLKRIARSMASEKRTADVLGRIGGEEFLLILPGHDRDGVLSAAERLRQAVEISGLEDPDAQPTVSAGVALYPDDGRDWDGLYVIADRRMYRAKQSGRNRVEGPAQPAAS